jgi:DNA modification methylase
MTSVAGEGWTMHHGNCLDVMPTLGPVALVLADPPYGIDCTKTGAGGTDGRVRRTDQTDRFTQREGATIAGDKKPDGRWLVVAAALLRQPGILYSFSRWDVDREWHSLIEAAGLTPKNRIVWAKANFGSGDLTGAFGCQHETLWRAAKGRARLRVARSGDVWADLWTECVRHGKTHPFEKPIDLLSKAIIADSDPYDLVLDPFAGSGSTGVAALRTGRRFVGVEKDRRWFDLAVERLRAEECQSDIHSMRAGQLGLLGGVK